MIFTGAALAAGGADGPCSETYPGSVARGPGSEPELQGYTALVDTLLADQRGPGDEDAAPITTTGIFVSIHSGTRWILIPYDWRTHPAPNDPDLEAVWDKVATWTPGWPSCSTGECYGLVAGSARIGPTASMVSRLRSGRSAILCRRTIRSMHTTGRSCAR